MNLEDALNKLRRVSRHCTDQIKVYTEARKQIQNTIRQIKRPAPKQFVEPTGDISIETIAELIQKHKRKISQPSMTKAVKRATIGIKPLGIEGLDYHKVIATQTHVNDKTANFVGEQIFTFVKCRTKFHANDVRHLWQ
ncbi:MAG: hypothetical protein CME38_06540 [Haliea sp.]|nr:hypothetical protein [Haliea sp.]|tara:strand:- start:27 stop:440 length:414 start_codon:yes stop_codon:yes gene_type:complete